MFFYREVNVKTFTLFFYKVVILPFWICKDIASKAKHVLVCIMKRLSSLNNNSLNLFLKIFDTQVLPVMQYGSEIWGLSKAALHCESVHLFALKKFLNVDRRTPNDLIYGETNRYPLYINSAVQCIRYWFKLLQMEEFRIPFKSYKMLFELDARGKINWVSDVRNCLCKHGFGEVWFSQGVGNMNVFIKLFRQRLIDCRWQEWNEHIQSSHRFGMYRTFCSSHEMKLYLSFDMGLYLKHVTTKFRLGISDLTVHYYRYREHTYDNMICPLCKNDKEDEVHFVLCCPATQKLREKYIPSKYYRSPCLFKLNLLMSSQRHNDVWNFSLFLHKAFKLREIAVS